MTDWINPVHDALRAVLPAKWGRLEFMLNALLIVGLLAPVCAALGVKVVNFRMAFFSDAISHSAFTGVVIGFILVRVLFTRQQDIDHWDRILPLVTLVVFGLLVAGGITAIKRRTDLASDTVIGVFFATVIAGGIAVMSYSNLQGNFEEYLYGSILTASPGDVAVAAGLALAVFLFLAFSFNALMLIGLNDELAASRAIHTRLYDYLFAALLALVVTLSIRTVGLLLVTAMLVVPAAAARNIAGSAGGMLRWATAIGFLAGVGGLILAFYLNLAAGAAIILLASAVFVLTLALRPVRKTEN